MTKYCPILYIPFQASRWCHHAPKRQRPLRPSNLRDLLRSVELQPQKKGLRRLGSGGCIYIYILYIQKIYTHFLNNTIYINIDTHKLKTYVYTHFWNKEFAAKDKVSQKESKFSSNFQPWIFKLLLLLVSGRAYFSTPFYIEVGDICQWY